MEKELKVAQRRKISLPVPPLKLPPHTHNVRVWGAALAEQARGGGILGGSGGALLLQPSPKPLPIPSRFHSLIE